MKRGGRRISGTRGVLEGLPLTLLISIIIIALGTAVLLGLYLHAQSTHLSSIYVARGTAKAPVNGWLPIWSGNMSLFVTATSETNGGLGGVTVTVNGSGINVIGKTTSNGTVDLTLPQPMLPTHAEDGSLTIVATYTPPPTLGASTIETDTISEVILG